jgi:hypothetical protein
MDNARFHHSNDEFYDNYPYEIKYLPRYLPFLNPCEEVFYKIKCCVRGASSPLGQNELIQRMLRGSESVTDEDLSHYFQHSEQFF